MSEGSGSFPSLPTIPAGLSGSDRLLARLGELWLRSKFLFLPDDRALFPVSPCGTIVLLSAQEGNLWFLLKTGECQAHSPGCRLGWSLSMLRPGRKPGPVESALQQQLSPPGWMEILILEDARASDWSPSRICHMFLWNLGPQRVTHWPKPGPHLCLRLSLFRSVSRLIHFSFLCSDFTQWQRWVTASEPLGLQSLHC